MIGRSATVTILLLSLAGLAGCHQPPAPPPVRPPTAGYWFDSFRARRQRLTRPEFLAGAAKVKLTPTRRGVRIAGHGVFRKHSRGVLDDLWGRVLYLDSGPQAVVLVSLDFIGWMYPRTQRIRARVTRRHPHSIIIAATHNHDGPDTEGIWGPGLLGMVPTRSGVDQRYLDRVERRVARAILRAVARARPARLYLGRFPVPEGLAVNLREPEDLPLVATVLRAADARDDSTIGTVINWGNHAEALQDHNRWLSADWPGVMCREVDLALGGVTLFFSAPAGGMIEPANRPDDPEPQRLAFCRHLGGSLAAGAINLAIGGMESCDQPEILLAWQPVRFSLQPGSTIALVFRLGLLEPRPLPAGRLLSEMELIDLGKLQIATVPAELTPAVGRLLEARLTAPYHMLITLGLDHLGYVITHRQWADARFEYERSMSLGPDTVDTLVEGIEGLTTTLRSARR